MVSLTKGEKGNYVVGLIKETDGEVILFQGFTHFVSRIVWPGLKAQCSRGCCTTDIITAWLNLFSFYVFFAMYVWNIGDKVIVE